MKHIWMKRLAWLAGILCAMSLGWALGCGQNAGSELNAVEEGAQPAAISGTEAASVEDAGKDGEGLHETGDAAEGGSEGIRDTEALGEQGEGIRDTEALGERGEEIQGAGISEKGDETSEEKTKRLRSEVPEAPAILPEEVTDLSIQIHKAEHSLQLWDGGTLIAEYAVGLAKNPEGAKEREGDNKNPEGTYYVCNKNSGSQYHLALGLSYPNAQDAKRGYEEGLISEEEMEGLIRTDESGEKPDWYTALGGEIMIHGQKGEQGGGSDWTRGCFAVDNEVMDLIWDYVEVGTKVTITPD